MKIKDYGTLPLGLALELKFSEIVDPLTGDAYSDVTPFDFEFTTKESRDDLDEDAISTVKDQDPEFNSTAGSIRVQVVNSTVSATLEIGKTYFFDGWMKATDQPWRVLNLGSKSIPAEIGKFRVTRPVNKTKET